MLENMLNTTGKRVRALRQNRKLSQLDLARMLSGAGAHVVNSYLSRVESDDLQPSHRVLVALARSLDTSTDFLLLVTNDPTPTAQAKEEPVYA